MGLDLYAYAVTKEKLKDPTQEVAIELVEGSSEEIAYWHKQNPLHNWMENLYRKKYGTVTDFNCVSTR